MPLEEEPLASPCDASPRSVTSDILPDLPPLGFCQHAPLAYAMMWGDHTHIGAATDREDMGWILPRS